MSKIKNIFYGTVIGALIAVLSSGISGCSKKELEEELQAPSYAFHSNIRINFEDDFAPGMRAFIEYDDQKIELTAFVKTKTDYTFGIPKEVRVGGKKFKAYAIDIDGNKSEENTFYTLDGIVLSDKNLPKNFDELSKKINQIEKQRLEQQKQEPAEEQIPEEQKAPCYDSNSNKYIYFDDNSAPGMRAFVEYDDKKIELNPSVKDQEYYSFTIPKELVVDGKRFKAYAIDRDGNKSEENTFYTLDGVLMLDKGLEAD